MKRLGTNVRREESARTCAEARDKFALCTSPVHRTEIERLPPRSSSRTLRSDGAGQGSTRGEVHNRYTPTDLKRKIKATFKYVAKIYAFECKANFINNYF